MLASILPMQLGRNCDSSGFGQRTVLWGYLSSVSEDGRRMHALRPAHSVSRPLLQFIKEAE